MGHSVGQRIMGLAVIGSILTTAVILGLSFGGQTLLYSGLASWESSLRISSDSEADSISSELAERRLLGMAKVKARTIDLTMQYNIDDVRMTVYQLALMMEHPEQYPRRNLPDPLVQSVFPEEGYIYYSPDVRSENKKAELSGEIGLMSNISDGLVAMVKREKGKQAAFYVASEHGYLICCDSLYENYKPLGFTEDFSSQHDPRKAQWYTLAKESGETIVTDYYVGGDGYPIITIAIPYYDDGEFAGVAGADVSLQTFQEQMNDAVMGITNFNFAINEEGKLMFSSRPEGALALDGNSDDLRTSDEKSIAEAAARMMAGEEGTMPVMVDGETYYLAFAPIPSIGWSFGTLLAAGEVQAPMQEARMAFAEKISVFSDAEKPFFDRLGSQSFWLAGILLLVMLAAGGMMAARFSRPIYLLAEGAKEIAKGNLDRRFDIRTGDEVEELADGFNVMTGELKAQLKQLAEVTAEKERIATEMNLAALIQTSALPKLLPDAFREKPVLLYASMHPAKEVGGDFYDFYFTDENHIVITIADVSDKGVPAALFMMIAKIILKNNAMTSSPDELADVVMRSNDQLYEENSEDMFVTVFIGQLNLLTGEFIYVNAGHNPPMIRSSRQGAFEYLPKMKKSPMLGIQKGLRYQQRSLFLAPGETVFLYTDGVTEAMDESGRILSEERLEAVMNRQSGETEPRELIESVRRDIADHVGNAEQSDDITMLALRYIGASSKKHENGEM